MQGYQRAMHRFAEFRGRSNRSEFWGFLVVSQLVVLAAASIDLVLGLEIGGVLILSGIAGAVYLPPTIAVLVRRLHDLNVSMWWLWAPYLSFFLCILSGLEDRLIIAVPLAEVAIIILACLLPGNRDANRYGPPNLSFRQADQQAAAIPNLDAIARMREGGPGAGHHELGSTAFVRTGMSDTAPEQVLHHLRPTTEEWTSKRVENTVFSIILKLLLYIALGYVILILIAGRLLNVF